MVAPRDWLKEPEKFGRSRTAEWKRQPDRFDVHTEQSAAFLHHQFSCDVRAALDDDGRTIRWLADATGYRERHLSHVLRGRQQLTIVTMVSIVWALDRVELWPAPASIDDMRPPVR